MTNGRWITSPIRKIIALLMVFAALLPLHDLSTQALAQRRGSTGGSVRVRGYTRKDGTYVAPHYRSKPDGNFSNNWSTKGNINPYTGKEGTLTGPPAGYGGKKLTPSRSDKPGDGDTIPNVSENKEAAAKRLEVLGQVVEWRTLSLLDLHDMERRIQTAGRLSELGVSVEWKTLTFRELVDMEDLARKSVAGTQAATNLPIRDSRSIGTFDSDAIIRAGESLARSPTAALLDGVRPDLTVTDSVRVASVEPTSRLEAGAIILGIARANSENFTAVTSWAQIVVAVTNLNSKQFRVRWRDPRGNATYEMNLDLVPQTPSATANPAGREANKEVQKEKLSDARLSSAVQCSGTTLKGARCKRRTTNPSGRCYQHLP